MTVSLSQLLEMSIPASIYKTNNAGAAFTGAIPNGSINVKDAVDSYMLNVPVSSLKVTQLSNSTSVPTIAAGAGAGTSPTLTITSGGDLAHVITIATGTDPAASNPTLATVTFGTARTTTPVVVLYPGNAAAAALSGATQVYTSTESVTNYLIKAGSTALAASTTYIWKAIVLG